MKDISDVIMIGSGAPLRNPYPKIYVNTSIEHELYYKQHGKYPNLNEAGFKIPEEIRERALDIEDRLFK